MRGKIKEFNKGNYTIMFSENSKKFMVTDEIEIKTNGATINLELDDEIFLKFKNVSIKNNKLLFESLEIYKYVDKIEKEKTTKEFWVVIDDFDGFVKFSGEGFTYGGNRYVESYMDYSTDGKKYFIDIYDGQLLIEEYKNIIWPKKWFNMINPQETYFDEIIKIYQ